MKKVLRILVSIATIIGVTAEIWLPRWEVVSEQPLPPPQAQPLPRPTPLQLPVEATILGPPQVVQQRFPACAQHSREDALRSLAPEVGDSPEIWEFYCATVALRRARSHT